MPSITYWNRLEPRPRDPDIRPGLAARVRDPLWFLTRQWQLGELRGEDAGSIAFATIRAREARITAWSGKEGVSHALPTHALLEANGLAETFTADLSLRVELGLEFERIVRASAADADAAMRVFRSTFPIGPAGDDDAALLALWDGRVADGVAIIEAATPPAGVDPAAATWMQALRDHVASTYGVLATTDPEGWRPDRLEYALETTTAEATFATHPDRNGDISWYSFETRQKSGPQAQPLPAQEVIPGRAAFRGMPSARFWQFEAGAFVPGDVRPDKRDLATLIVIDYALVHANDWFVVPFEQTVGSLCAIDELVIRDTFGDEHTVRRADENVPAGSQRWSMYSIVDETASTLGPWFAIPPVGVTSTSRVVEDVRFFRDEIANMVWAVEHTLQGSLGNAVSGHELAMREQPPTAPPAPASAPLRYRIQTDVPSHWIPFVPVVLDDSLRDIALERAAMLRTTEGGPAEPILPRGRILEAAIRVREEEVPREGTRVVRAFKRARTADGGTRIWLARARSIGRGEGSSQLKFDIARAE